MTSLGTTVTNTLYADTANVVEAIKRAVETTDVGDDAKRVTVYDSEATMRGITSDEVDERNLFGHLGEHICTLEYDGTRLTVNFHQRQIEGDFRLSPLSNDAVLPSNQASSPKELAPRVGEVLRSVERQWDVITYDFAEVSAGSMAAGGHLTDFEFEYVVTSTEF